MHKETKRLSLSLGFAVLGARLGLSSSYQWRCEGLCDGVFQVHLPVPIRQLLWTLPERVPTGLPGRSRWRHRHGWPGSQQSFQSGVLAPAHRFGRVNCWWGSDQLYASLQPVSCIYSFLYSVQFVKLFTARCTIVRRAILRAHVVCPSVRLWRWWIRTT